MEPDSPPSCGPPFDYRGVELSPNLTFTQGRPCFATSQKWFAKHRSDSRC